MENTRTVYLGPDRAERDRRLSGRPVDSSKDDRSEAERDRDRIVYSTAWRRLVAVTQVVTPFDDVPLLHNRLTHSEKVAQVARSIGQRILRRAHTDSGREDLLSRLGGYDVDVCEAAALAHDLGHPPFGHIGETVLDRTARQVLGLDDGFEGNAQSIRIVTIGRTRSQKYEGIDPTMATLAAIAKYPWARIKYADATQDKSADAVHDELLETDREYSKKWKKFNFYEPETELLARCRAFAEDLPGDTQTLESSTMDVADDITYAVHDLEDAYVARILEMEAVISDLESASAPSSLTHFSALSGRLQFAYPEMYNAEQFDTAAGYVAGKLRRSFTRAMQSDSEAEAFARQGGSDLVGRYINAVDLQEHPIWSGGPYIGLTGQEWHEVQILKEITRSYVIRRPDIALLQIGQQSIIESLVTMLNSWLKSDPDRLPPRLRYEVGIANGQAKGEIPVGYKYGEHAPRGNPKRAILDYICTLGDAQCAALYYKLSGMQFQRVAQGMSF